jgi:thymidylate kinase
MPSLLRRSDAGRTAWVYVVVAVNALHLWRLVLGRRGGPAVLIFDRFTPDTTVKIDLHFLRSRGIDTRLPRGLFTLLSPKPDVGFLVAVSPEVAYHRRQEQTPEELTSMSQLYEEQVDRYGLRVLDGTLPGHELAAVIAVEAWQGLR